VTETQTVDLAEDDFDGTYQLRMIMAYPVIADMSRDELMFATPEEKRAAFQRILAAKNLRRTHELYLADRSENHDRYHHC
jgi:hypothetical protein